MIIVSSFRFRKQTALCGISSGASLFAKVYKGHWLKISREQSLLTIINFFLAIGSDIYVNAIRDLSAKQFGPRSGPRSYPFDILLMFLKDL